MDVVGIAPIDGIKKILNGCPQVGIAAGCAKCDLCDVFTFSKLFNDVFVLTRKILVDIENIHVNNAKAKKNTSRRRCLIDPSK